jgi:hypothetical protein
VKRERDEVNEFVMCRKFGAAGRRRRGAGCKVKSSTRRDEVGIKSVL